MRRRLHFIAMTLILLAIACGQSDKHAAYSGEQHIHIETELKEIHSTDSLIMLIKQYEEQDDVLRQMIALRQLGKTYREQSFFDKAIDYHLKGLALASEVRDTTEMIMALNNLGTCYRRIGQVEDALQSHLQALTYCMKQSDSTSYDAKKNRVVSLNGLGNVYLTLHNWTQADSVFRLSLDGEKELNSVVGEAINLANLGAVKRALGQRDSAWYYYQRSLKKNEEVGSTIGIALCHNHFGELYEDEGLLDNAVEEYQQASDLMAQSLDDWHRLEAQLSMVRIYIKLNHVSEAKSQLDNAYKTATRIGSIEHCARIHYLLYELYEKTGQPKQALDNYIISRQLDDSVLNMQKVNEIQNMRVSVERERQQHQLEMAKEYLDLERSAKHTAWIAAIAILLLAIVGLCFMWYHMRNRSAKQLMLQQMQQSRESFFTNVTHEFRTPLTVIIGMGHQLEDQNIEDMNQVRSAAKMIVRQGNSLLGLINQLLDISKIRSAICEPKWRRGDIVAYLEIVMQNFKPYAENKQQDLTFTHTQSQLEMDFVPDYIQKIISNLVSNSIKFTPQYGKINVMVDLISGDRMKLQVIDTGRGIDAKTLPHIFETFYQGEQKPEDIGTGVGLSLVRMMAEAMNGTVTADSTEGQGSTFTVIMPLKHAEAVEALSEADLNVVLGIQNEEHPLTDSDNTGEGTSVLIVEDNQDIAYYIGLHLKNYQLLYANTGEDGLEKALQMLPDLIVTDIMMPGRLNGLDFCRQVRSNELLSHIPIIIITAKTSEEDRRKGIEAGADAYLVKPFNSEELLVRVNKLLERQQILRQHQAQVSPDIKQQDANLSAHDRKFLDRLDNVILRLMGQGNTDIEAIAREMSVTRIQLNRKLLAIAGQNASTYTTRIRLAHAQQLLKDDMMMSIGDVAQKCGFDDVALFTRLFSQTFDTTPSQYRKEAE